MNNDNPASGSGDSESISGICSNPSGYDCQTVSGLSMINVDVNKTTCSSRGITCKNSDQSKRCPDFKVRAKCPCSGNIQECCNNLLTTANTFEILTSIILFQGVLHVIQDHAEMEVYASITFEDSSACARKVTLANAVREVRLEYFMLPY